jgi:hypothetical protein
LNRSDEEDVMHDTSTSKTARKRNAAKDLAPRKRADVKGGFVVDWAAAKPSRPGEERGVIAIIKPAAGGA